MCSHRVRGSLVDEIVQRVTTARRDRWLGYEWLTVENSDWIRSLDVQERLWEVGSIRSVPLPDLLIAAVAERHRVSILHYDADYDQIAAITGQPTEWIVPRGSVS